MGERSRPIAGDDLRLLHPLCLVAAFVATAAVQHAHADTFGSGANRFDIEFVSIGNPGNAADTTGVPNPAGAVAYDYRMGKFEISEQMIDKANAEGGLGITKDTRGAEKPATSTSWNEAARFVNWLNTSAGRTPAYKFAMQPGEVGYDANANIEPWTVSDAGYNPNNLHRNTLARYFLPSLDEWYKAAYYDPTSGVYYDYPTDAGALSSYGTAGQGGNVWEVTDWHPVNFRGLRGGHWNSSISSLRASSHSNINPAIGDDIVGFRVASSIPKPSTLLLLCVGSLAVLWRRRGSNSFQIP